MNFTWSEDKNYRVRRRRGIAFEDVAIAFLQGNVIDIIYDHNPEKYPGQHLLLVMVQDYLCTVPYYQIGDDTMALITIYQDSRRMSRYGLAGRHL